MGFDKIYNFFTKGNFDCLNDDESWEKEIIDNKNSDEVWICFLGWRTSIPAAKKLNLLPSKGKVVVYREPSALVNKNPEVARKLFLKIYEDAKQYLDSEVNVFAVSLGNMHGFYITSRFDVKRFVSLLPGPELGKNIWKSCATCDMRMESEVLGFSQKEYDKVLKDFNCVGNCSNFPKNSSFYIAIGDEYIPSEDQVSLIEQIKKKNSHVSISFFYLGHIFSHIYFGLLNRFGRISWG